jgi:2-polyprenyl-3-methyl-5-hydroxy-6-metoxy-1,4-benzoquinol methylase
MCRMSNDTTVRFDGERASESASANVNNVWNDRSLSRHRIANPARPWYFFARRLLESCKCRGNRALDVGCGVGEFLEVLRCMGFCSTGLDGNQKQIDSVRARGYDAKLANLEMPLPVEDASFDLAVCLEVIEHVSRAEFLLAEINRALAPGGALVLSTPNIAFWRYRLRCVMGAPPVGEGTHVRFFVPHSLSAAIENAGFAVVRRGSYGTMTGINYVLNKAGRPSRFWRVPQWLESLCAVNLVVVARKL